MRVAKDTVDYSKGKPKAHCGICEYYSNRRCQKVLGLINPKMWCRLFKHWKDDD